MTILLYRAAIHDLRGDAVLPLNQLRDQHPDLYEREAAKYAARPETMTTPVYPLGCTEPLYPWADIPHVLHRGPIPVSLFRA